MKTERQDISHRPLYGIIGGMGPMSSLEFSDYIYTRCGQETKNERVFPRLVLISDPLAPDRVNSYYNDNFESLRKYIEKMIDKLNIFRVDRIMICCLVAHACFSKMKKELLGNVISIIDLIEHEIRKIEKDILIFSTPMFYSLKLIRQKNIIYAEDFERINFFIKKFKTEKNEKDYLEFINYIQNSLKEYNCSTALFACSDLHGCYRYIRSTSNKNLQFRVIDSIDLAATYLLHDTQDASNGS